MAIVWKELGGEPKLIGYVCDAARSITTDKDCIIVINAIQVPSSAEVNVSGGTLTELVSEEYVDYVGGNSDPVWTNVYSLKTNGQTVTIQAKRTYSMMTVIGT